MNSTIKFIILLISFAALIGGSYFLYSTLTADADNSQLVIYDEKDKENNADKDDSTADSVTKEPQDTQTSDEPASDDVPTDDPAQENPTEDNSDANEPTTDDSTEAVETVQDFLVYDEAGAAHRLSDYFGKPIVLNFWASWCGPCRSEMPHFEEMYKKYGDNVEFLMVNLTTGRETVASAAEFVEENGYTFPVLYDTESYAAYAYSVYSIPTTYFINKDGTLAARATGAISLDTLEQGIEIIK